MSQVNAAYTWKEVLARNAWSYSQTFTLFMTGEIVYKDAFSPDFPFPLRRFRLFLPRHVLVVARMHR
jgi:hypothetical protein